MAQWIRHRSTEPEIVGSSPTRITFSLEYNAWGAGSCGIVDLIDIKLRSRYGSSDGVTVSTLDFESSDGGSNPP